MSRKSYCVTEDFDAAGATTCHRQERAAPIATGIDQRHASMGLGPGTRTPLRHIPDIRDPVVEFAVHVVDSILDAPELERPVYEHS
ncbi:hypothetical protein RhoFasB10_00403 [Rhodococcus sp. B10]|nr:hypothetical protein [Rhodococcus sp. B10]